ncbi:MAG: carboxypeptidase regulatory-like domain-containing protein, partial [Prevotellaceae bacterium]|nr:carboxypeptidase regulatory-like domain-containing protein [Prevotellaceae bacterium]
GTTEKTYTLDFSANVVGANTWVADFNSTSSTIPFPAGSVAEGGVRTDYTYISSGNYDGCLYSYNTDSYAEANNKFITPKLHAKAGDVLTFDVSRYSNNSAAKYNLKVYVSTDRKTWGEPVYTVTADQLTSTYQNVSIPFDTEGDYYVGFAIFYVRLDNIIGLEKVDVAHDLYIYSTEWPETSIKSGVEQSKPSLDIIPLTDETADNYTVKFIYGDNVVEGTPVALTATATTRKSFSFKWTPEVEQTTAYTGAKVVFEFTDGTKFETDAFDFTVTKEPVFHFLNNKYTSRWYEPSDYTTPINFGKTTTEDTKTFYIFNWGSAPLTVKNVTMPEGFTASATTMTIPAFDGTQDGLETCQQTLDFTFTATEIGTYSGDIVITYVGADGEDATFTTSVIGTRLDPTLFYATFDDGNNNSVWPAGSVYKGISTSNTGTSYEANYAITGTGTFVTPKLHAQAGDKILFDAKLYNSNASWKDATVTVYAAATREEALNDDEETATRVELGCVSGLDEENPILPDYKTFEITVPTAGDYYLAFELAGSPRVDEIYGLTVVDVAHDWILGTTNVPETAMQNVNSTAKIALTNLGLHTETAYTIVAYVDGKATETEGTPDIPVVNQLTAVSATIEAPFKSPKVGTFPVYFEIKADDYVVATEPVDVEFTEEVASADGVQVGTPTNTGRDFGFVDWYNTDSNGGTRYTDILYTAAKIEAAGLKSGDKISSITFKGINTEKGAFTKACVTSWVATSTGEIAFGQPDKEAMIEVVVYDPNDATFVFPDNIESVITLPEPIVWDGTSDIRVYTEAVGQGSGNWQTVNYAYDNDIEMSYNGTKKAGPVAYFQLVVEPASISGTVTDGENAIEGATVTLVSNDGDDIQYTGTTDAEGAYDINVVQSNRTYDVTVTAEGYKAQTATADFSETATPTLDFVLAKDEFVNLDFEASTPTTIGVRTTQGDANSKGGIAHMQEVEGWTIASTNGDNRAAAVYAYGSDVFLGGEGYLAPAVSPTGKESNALGLVSVWSSTSQYTQEAALAAGKYVITVPVYNSVGGTTAISKNLIGMSVDGTNHYATTTQYPVNTWKYETISFDVETATRGTLSVGYTPVNTGSANMPHLFIDKVDVQVFESDEARDAYLATIPALEAKATLNVAIANANAKAENTDLFGDELLQYDADAFNAAIADAQAVLDNAESTLEEIQAALASLNLENYLNKPEAGKLYTIQLKDTDLYMALDGGTKLSDAVVGLSFEAMDNGNYAITNGEGEYVAYTGTGDNTWSMGSSATPYAWKVTLIGDGYYTIAKATNTNHLIGVDETEAGKNCYANKSQNDKSLWKIYETPEIIPEYTITVAATENGVVVADKQTAAAGDVVTLTITPDDDYELDALTVTTGESDDATEVELTADNTFIMPAGNVTITATFVAVSHTITIVTSEHGTVEADKQTATAGEVVTLTITPDEGYELKTLTVTTGEGDDATEVELTADNTFVMPAGDVTIMAIFVQSTPVGINGLTIDTNATDVYDLQGRKVQNIVKGQVYIVNGKKVWVK